MCICLELRACEQRMLDDDVFSAAYHGQKGYDIGYAAALDRAVQRVEALEYISTIGVTLSSVVPKAAVIAAIKGDQSTEDRITFIRGNDRLEQLRKNNS
jgi:hypothetical protein